MIISDDSNEEIVSMEGLRSMSEIAFNKFALEQEEFEAWEDWVREKFIINFYNRGRMSWISFGDMDNDIIVKMLQNDIRLFLEKVWTRFSWEIKITYKAWVPKIMVADFQSLDNNANDLYDEFRDFISN